MKKITLQIVMMWFCSFILFAQIPANFSGKWSFNQSKSKSAAGTSFAGSEVTLDIVQTQTSIKITRTNKNQGGVVDTTVEEYTLDGKEQVTKQDQLITKKTGSWSADKQKIILIMIDIMGKNEFRREDSYSLSDGGKTLVIQSIQTMGARAATETLIYEKR
jgi:hypothetical protein